MRLPLLLAVLSLSACSLLGTRRPDPPPYTVTPECNPGYARPITDTALGAAGFGFAGLGVAVATRPPLPGESSPVGPGLAMAGAGAAFAALFATSAIIGYQRVGACQRAIAEWQGDHPEEKVTTPEERLAREYLRCPIDTLSTRELAFAGGDARRDTHPWAQREVSGCGRVAWCGESDGRARCGATADLEFAAGQLAVETACPARSIEQEEFFGMGTQNTYRLNACGNQFSCVVPLIMVTEKSAWTGARQERERAAGSAFGSQLTCKPVVAPARAAPPAAGEELPPPPPPAQP